MGNSITRLASSLLILLAMAAMTCSQVPVHLGGNDGVALMKNLTNSSPIMAEAINISANDTDINDTDINNTTTNGTDGGLWSWGSRPRAPPAPPTEAQYREALNAKVIMDNRVE